jgi:hypothetical protein
LEILNWQLRQKEAGMGAEGCRRAQDGEQFFVDATGTAA